MYLSDILSVRPGLCFVTSRITLARTPRFNRSVVDVLTRSSPTVFSNSEATSMSYVSFGLPRAI